MLLIKSLREHRYLNDSNKSLSYKNAKMSDLLFTKQYTSEWDIQ